MATHHLGLFFKHKAAVYILLALAFCPARACEIYDLADAGVGAANNESRSQGLSTATSPTASNTVLPPCSTVRVGDSELTRPREVRGHIRYLSSLPGGRLSLSNGAAAIYSGQHTRLARPPSSIRLKLASKGKYISLRVKCSRRNGR